MHIFSYGAQPTMEVNIHNQCSNFALSTESYSNACACWCKNPYWKSYDINMKSDGFSHFLATFGGVLTYTLDREGIKPDEELEPTHIRLFIAWKAEGCKDLRAFVQLIECDKTLYWGKIRLREYYQRHANQFSAYTGPIKDTWLIYNNIVVMIRLELNFTQRDGVLNITISESVRDEHTKRPIGIGLKR
jgi:hypothetical protein